MTVKQWQVKEKIEAWTEAQFMPFPLLMFKQESCILTDFDNQHGLKLISFSFPFLTWKTYLQKFLVHPEEMCIMTKILKLEHMYLPKYVYISCHNFTLSYLLIPIKLMLGPMNWKRHSKIQF